MSGFGVGLGSFSEGFLNGYRMGGSGRANDAGPAPGSDASATALAAPVDAALQADGGNRQWGAFDHQSGSIPQMQRQAPVGNRVRQAGGFDLPRGAPRGLMPRAQARDALQAGGQGWGLPGYTPSFNGPNVPRPDFGLPMRQSQAARNPERARAVDAPWYGQPANRRPAGGEAAEIPDDFWQQFEDKYAHLLDQVEPQPGTLEYAQQLLANYGSEDYYG